VRWNNLHKYTQIIHITSTITGKWHSQKSSTREIQRERHSNCTAGVLLRQTMVKISKMTSFLFYGAWTESRARALQAKLKVKIKKLNELSSPDPHALNHIFVSAHWLQIDNCFCMLTRLVWEMLHFFFFFSVSRGISPAKNWLNMDRMFLYWFWKSHLDVCNSYQKLLTLEGNERFCSYCFLIDSAEQVVTFSFRIYADFV